MEKSEGASEHAYTVIDIDIDADHIGGCALLDMESTLRLHDNPDAVVLRTPSGGLHLYYASAMAADKEIDTGRNPAPPNPVSERVRDTIKDLTERAVLPPDREKLRKALDTADAPRPGRDGADDALVGAARKGRSGR